jgi:hypothetical protein
MPKRMFMSPNDHPKATAGRAALRQGPTAVSAHYDEGLGEVVVRFSTGIGLLIAPSKT